MNDDRQHCGTKMTVLYMAPLLYRCEVCGAEEHASEPAIKMAAEVWYEGALLSRSININEGSKSERLGFKLRTDDAEYVIELVEENPFEQPTLRRLHWRRVRARGTVVAGKLLATAIEEVVVAIPGVPCTSCWTGMDHAIEAAHGRCRGNYLPRS